MLTDVEDNIERYLFLIGRQYCPRPTASGNTEDQES